MAKSKTVHIVPSKDGWAVMGNGKSRSTHSTQADAIKAARHLVRESVSGQFVVLRPDGQMGKHETYGLPKVQAPPRKSRLGTKKIEKAVGSLILDRLLTDRLPKRA